MTVVVESPTGLTWVGRYHERNSRGVLLHDVALHDLANSEVLRTDWIVRLRKFGIPPQQRAFTVPAELAGKITRLGEWEAS